MFLISDLHYFYLTMHQNAFSSSALPGKRTANSDESLKFCQQTAYTVKCREQNKTRLTSGDIGGGMLAAAGGARDRRHNESVRRGTFSHSSSSRKTDAVAPELPRPCADEPTDDAAGVSSVECSNSPSATDKSACAAGGGGGGGSPDDVLVFVLDDDECCFASNTPPNTNHIQLFSHPNIFNAMRTRSSATAERQRVSFTRLSRLTH